VSVCQTESLYSWSEITSEMIPLAKESPNQKSVVSLSLGFIEIVTVSPPVMFSMIVELVALVIVELSLLLFE
jgi:hypothetical protein